MSNDRLIVSRNQREGVFVGRGERRTRLRFGLRSGYTRTRTHLDIDYLSGSGPFFPCDSLVWYVQSLRLGRKLLLTIPD